MVKDLGFLGEEENKGKSGITKKLLGIAQEFSKSHLFEISNIIH